ncbi:ankyrin repeats (3 copies) domain protein [Fusarium subglutinans]|uniref:Ankyrin repeats (3 copies) domain protein n=1 Tax=Gibberella subglutinans TaxID=42677 RepID=A0A8H5Q0C4_GIBSU|nr:ankyrin repeats (3 copies) domain protein [Fusarium subglutinans]KAF5606219.1 ankyrin repeats (3 copies) domain protein [Fusarium subglutinans]
MTDPLSVTGLALAVVSLGLQVTGGITDYLDSLKSRDQDISSIIQQNDALRKTLRIIESSISRFQSDHRTATEALRQFLDSCNEELKALESMNAALITDDQGTTGRRTKARNKGKKLLYPFHRPKLEQMATKLHHINATLQLGLQSLGLDLLVVRSEVSAISTPIQGIQSTVSQFETRFDGLENLLQQLLVQGSTINGTLQEITPVMVTERLLRKPAVLQEMCDTVKTQEGFYHVAEVIGSHYNSDSLWRIRRNLDHSSPLIDLFEYLIMNKAPAMDYNTDGRTPLSILFTYGGVYGNVDHPQYAASTNLILRSNNEDALAHLSSADPASPAMIVNELGQEIVAQGEAVQLYFLSHSTEIARGRYTYTSYGCGPLSLAILSNNLAEVKSLIANHPGALSERTLFGQTPLHLAANKASILQVLVDAADTGLLNQRDLSGRSALEVAVSLSGLKCRESSRMCKRCTCAECALVLLEADCAVVTPWGLQTLLDSASKRCKQSYVRHMKDRRDRLKQLATDSLSTMDIQHIGLDSESALDSNAFEVSLLLQANNIEIPAALGILENESFPDQGTIYQQLDLPEDADLFFRVGFRDTRSWHSEAQMEPWHTPPWPDLSYLHWLASHGGITCQLPLSSSSDIHGVRLIFATLGHYIAESEKRNLPLPGAGRSVESNIGWLHETHVAVFTAGIPDECVCLCSTGGCCLMKFLLQGLLPNFGVEPWQYQIPEPSFLRNTADLGKHAFDGNEPLERTILFEKSLLNLIHSFITYLKHFSCYLGESHHYKALRYITFTALGLRHSCCAVDHDGSEDGPEDDQWHTLALLEDLLHEFEASLTAILQDPTKWVRDIINFWQRTWAGRMSGVLCHLEGSDLSMDEKLAAEEIGVVWNKVGPEIPGETETPRYGSAIEYWLSELRKIEEECE